FRRLIELGKQSGEVFHDVCVESGISSPRPASDDVPSAISPSSPSKRVLTSCASMPCVFSQWATISEYPCVTKTFCAPVSRTAWLWSSQSAWSDNTSPRSASRLLRVPRSLIHPEATPREEG